VQIAGGKTPRVYVSAPTNPNAPDEIEEAMTEIESSSRNDQQKLKTDCLRRDGFRCVISGLYDRQSIRDHLVTPPAGNPSGGTECAHILPFALRKFNERNSQQVLISLLAHSPTVFILSHFPDTFGRQRMPPPFGGDCIAISHLLEIRSMLDPSTSPRTP